MRRLVTLFLAILLSAAGAAAANAQKDPFQPLVEEGETAGTTAEAGAAATPVTAGGTARRLPQTGFDFMTPALMALVLLMAGAALLFLVRFAEAPVGPRPRSRVITQDIY